MATKIRLKRIGRRNRPFYRLVVMDARNRRDGAAIEEVGWYNPIAKDEIYSLKEDRILHWLQEGAQPTDTAHDILRTAGIAHKWHLMKQGLDEAAVEKEMKKWALEREDVLERRRQRAEAKVAEKKAAAGKKAAETAAEADKPAEPDAKAEPADEKEEPKEEDAADGDEASETVDSDEVDKVDVDESADTGDSGKGEGDSVDEDPVETEEELPAEETDNSGVEDEEAKADGAGDEETGDESAAEEEEPKEEAQKGESTEEAEPEKDESGKKGSKKTAKKNGQETDDK